MQEKDDLNKEFRIWKEDVRKYLKEKTEIASDFNNNFSPRSLVLRLHDKCVNYSVMYDLPCPPDRSYYKWQKDIERFLIK